jgi:hypothetical protein
MRLAWLAVGLMWILSPCGGARTIVVDRTGAGEFVTIQEGVDAAAGGDTVLIRPGLYEEKVAVVGKALTLRGSAGEVTELRWSSLDRENALDIDLHSGGGYCSTIESLTIAREPASGAGRAVYSHEYRLIMSGCRAIGSVGVGRFYGEAIVSDSQITQLDVQGGQRTSVISDSRIGTTYVEGWWTEASNSLVSSGTVYGSVGFGALTGMISERDSIGFIEVNGAADAYQYLEADGSTIADLVAMYGAGVQLRGCTLTDISYECEWMYSPYLEMSGCLVGGDFSLETLGVSSSSRVVPAIPYSRWAEGLSLQHNTFLGDVSIACDWYFAPADRRFRDNIVLGEADLDAPDLVVITHNDFVSGATITTPSDSVFANIESDPRFCGPPSGDYTIEDCSPCAGAAHDGTDIGAYGVGCACTAVRRTTWGAVKAMFR